MWKKYKTELLIGAFMIALVSFGLGCIFQGQNRGNMKAGNMQFTEQQQPGGNPPCDNGGFGNRDFGRGHHRGFPGNNGGSQNPFDQPSDNNGNSQDDLNKDSQDPKNEDGTTEKDKNDNETNTTENNNKVTEENHV